MVTQVMDYCVMDHETGEFIKNTGRAIEALAGPGSGNADMQEADSDAGQVMEDYQYYVVVSYGFVMA